MHAKTNSIALEFISGAKEKREMKGCVMGKRGGKRGMGILKESAKLVSLEAVRI